MAGKRTWTDEQSLAINTRDRTLLISAAAGAGKTATLTERIIRSLLDEYGYSDTFQICTEWNYFWQRNGIWKAMGSDEGEYTIYTDPQDLPAVRDAIISMGYKIDTADLAKVPSTYVELTSEEDVANMEKMLDKFNEDDDITAVYHNWDN